MFHSCFHPSSHSCHHVSLVSRCFAVAFVPLHIEHAIRSFLPCASHLPHLRCVVHPSLTLKPLTVTLVLEVPGLTTPRAPRVACDLTPVTVCVCMCVFSAQCAASIINTLIAV